MLPRRLNLWLSSCSSLSSSGSAALTSSSISILRCLRSSYGFFSFALWPISFWSFPDSAFFISQACLAFMGMSFIVEWRENIVGSPHLFLRLGQPPALQSPGLLEQTCAAATLWQALGFHPCPLLVGWYPIPWWSWWVLVLMMRRSSTQRAEYYNLCEFSPNFSIFANFDQEYHASTGPFVGEEG